MRCQERLIYAGRSSRRLVSLRAVSVYLPIYDWNPVFGTDTLCLGGKTLQ